MCRGTVQARSVLLLLSFVLAVAGQMSAVSSGGPAQMADVGKQACAKCHPSIYESYKHTAMAHASGPAEENFLAGDFVYRKWESITARTQKPDTHG